MRQWRFDRTVSIGNLVSLVLVLLSLYAAYAGIITRIAILDTKVDPMWRAFIQTRAVVATTHKGDVNGQAEEGARTCAR